MELSHYLNIVRRWIWLLALAAMIAGGTALWVYNHQPPVYAAQAKLVVGPGVDSPNPDLNALRTGGQLMQTYAQLATTRPVLQAVISDLGLRTTPEQLMQKIEVRSDAETQILTIRARDGDPARAAAIANAVADTLVSVGSASTGAPQAQLMSQMRNDADKLEQSTQESEAKIKQLEAQLQAPDPETGPAILEHETKILKFEAELQKPVDESTQQEIQNRETKVNQLEATLQATVDLTARRLILDQLTLEYNRLSDARNSDAERRRLILDQLSWERNRLADLQQADTAQRTLIRDQIAQERTRLSDTQRNLAQLYTSLQSNITNQLKVVEPAIIGTPVTPSLALTVLMAALAGAVLGLMLALVYEFFDDTIKTSEEFTGIAHMPALGTIAEHAKLRGFGRERLAVEAVPQSRAAENYRMVGTKLLSTNGNRPLQSILISNLQLGDDNAEIAANLAVTLAQTGKRIVLVDANLRHPAVGKLFGMLDGRGLTDALNGDGKRIEPFSVDWAPGLTLVPSGATTSNPFELLASPRMVGVIEELERETDMVLIAASPLLSFADSLLLASRVDGVVLIVRAGETPREVIRKGIESLQSLGAHIVGGILNNNPPTSAHLLLLRTGIQVPTIESLHSFGGDIIDRIGRQLPRNSIMR